MVKLISGDYCYYYLTCFVPTCHPWHTCLGSLSRGSTVSLGTRGGATSERKVWVGLVSIHAVTTPSTAWGHGEAYCTRQHFSEVQDRCGVSRS